MNGQYWWTPSTPSSPAPKNSGCLKSSGELPGLERRLSFVFVGNPDWHDPTTRGLTVKGELVAAKGFAAITSRFSLDKSPTIKKTTYGLVYIVRVLHIYQWLIQSCFFSNLSGPGPPKRRHEAQDHV